MLPPKLPLDKNKITDTKKKWAFVKESILLSIGFFMGKYYSISNIKSYGNSIYFCIFNAKGKRFYRVVAAVAAGILCSSFEK